MGAGPSQHEPLEGGVVAPVAPPKRSFSPHKTIRRTLRKRRKKHGQEDAPAGLGAPTSSSKDDQSSTRAMDRLRRSLRDNFRKKKEHIPEASKPHIWQTDEAAVRAGTCAFSVKYLGCVEVFESRGMQVCEEALKALRNHRRRPTRGILYVSGDGLRVVDDDTKGLIVDQTIEKVSFCAPDRSHEKGFSYICRDGTTRRWMCHGFLAVKETGERLSHAVGCAFAACLERKQKRDSECGVTMSFDHATSSFTRLGSFRQLSLTERISDPQECKPIEPVPLKLVENPHAIARPHATPLMLQRQGSFRVFSHLNQASPFKRQLSLRISDLPSTLERQRSQSLGGGSSFLDSNGDSAQSESPQLSPPPIQRSRLLSLPNAIHMAPIPEVVPISDSCGDAVSAMCQQLSTELSLLSSCPAPFSNDNFTMPVVQKDDKMSPDIKESEPSVEKSPAHEDSLWKTNDSDDSEQISRGEEWLAQIKSQSPLTNGSDVSYANKCISPPAGGIRPHPPPLAQLRSSSLGATPARDPFDAEWAALDTHNFNPNNPFLTSSAKKAFEVHM